jgi:hypothetical protein
VKSHAVPSQVLALAPVGLGHAVHDVVPQVSTLVLVAQIPAQLWVPVAHTPEHAAAASMQVPAHSFMPVGQAGRHAVPSQVTVPPAGSAHAAHEVAPQLPTSRLLTQRPPQTWKPVLHAMPHAPPTHWATPLGSVGQTVHAVPHAVASPSAAHLAAHLCVPVMHWKSHEVPSQVACVAPVGTGHGKHDVPHAFTSITDGHKPLHACCAAGHAPAHAAVASMHPP